MSRGWRCTAARLAGPINRRRAHHPARPLPLPGGPCARQALPGRHQAEGLPSEQAAHPPEATSSRWPARSRPWEDSNLHLTD